MNKGLKAFGLNFQSIKSLINKQKGDLIADYVMIPACKSEFVLPYNLIYNHNSKKYQPCLVILFLYVRTENKNYPILFDYWISKVGYQCEDDYLTKNEIFIKSLDFVINQGLEFNYLIFDSGFSKSNVINYLSQKKIKYISRIPKNKWLDIDGQSQRVSNLFDDYNGSFYYYHPKHSFLKSKTANCFEKEVNIIAIAGSKTKLLNKDLVFLITNDLSLTHVEVQRLYKSRWCIEIFFKILKSYLSLSTFYRHNWIDVEEKINLSLSAFFIIQELSHKLGDTFYQTLRLIQRNQIDLLLVQTIKSSHKYIYTYVSENKYLKTIDL